MRQQRAEASRQEPCASNWKDASRVDLELRTGQLCFVLSDRELIPTCSHVSAWWRLCILSKSNSCVLCCVPLPHSGVGTIAPLYSKSVRVQMEVILGKKCISVHRPSLV